MAVLVEHLQDHPGNRRFYDCGGSWGGSSFEGKDPHHTMVEGRWPTSLDEGRGTARDSEGR